MKIKQPNQNLHLRYILVIAMILGVFILVSQLFFNGKKDIPFVEENYETTPDSIIQKLTTEMDILEVLDAFKTFDIYWSVKDDAATKLDQILRDTFAKMGAEEFSKIEFRDSYLAHYQEGRIVHEKRSATDSLSYKKGKIEVFSAGNKVGNFSRIKVHNRLITRPNRGLNIYIYNPSNKDIYHYNFDFYKYENPEVTGLVLNEFYQAENQIEIILNKDDYRKMDRKRKEAIKQTVLLTSKEDLVSAKVKYKGKTYEVKLRLKGDWTDHLSDNKWSFRIILDGEETLLGMRKFSLHHPKARNFLGEWIFHQLLRKEDVLNLQYDFLNVQMTVNDGLTSESMDWGLYALEEGFDKYLLERQQRREGVILKLDESGLWEERVNFLNDGMNVLEVPSQIFVEDGNLPVVPFSEGKVMRDSNMSKQFIVGRDLFQAYLNRELPPGEVFDLERLAKFNAICAFVGGSHALNMHNARVYFNPINGKLEPVGFDANAWQRSYWMPMYYGVERDLEYLKSLGGELEKILSEEYDLQKIMNIPGLKERLLQLKKAYSYYNFDDQVVRINRANIRNALFPSHCMNIFFEQLEGTRLEVIVEHFGRFPTQIFSLKDKDNRSFAKPEKETIIMPGERRKVTFVLDQNFKKLFVSKKMKRAEFDAKKDLDKVKVMYSSVGTSRIQSEIIRPWKAREEAFKRTHAYSKKPNFKDFEFIEVDEENKVISCKSGVWRLKEELRIPAGYTFKMVGGTKLNISNFQAQVVSRSPVLFIGTAENPVEFVSETGSGSGLFVLEAGDTSYLDHCVFRNLRFPTSTGWSVSGGVNFYNSPVKISNTTISQSRSEDALNIIRSYFEMDNVIFTDTRSDAFDGDFVEGVIRNSTFIDLGNDGIDVSGSNIEVENVKIIRAGDKGLSGGEDSQMRVKNIEIQDSEVAVAGKDKSEMILQKVILRNNKLGFTAFQKKSEFGPSNMVANEVTMDSNLENFLIEVGSSLKLNGAFVKTQTGVKERMYGAEFGKASN